MILHAVDRFRREAGNGGTLPLGGQIPDMTASTTTFMQLQKVCSRALQWIIFIPKPSLFPSCHTVLCFSMCV